MPVSINEMLLILFIGLLVTKPEHLPEKARSMGRFIKWLRELPLKETVLTTLEKLPENNALDASPPAKKITSGFYFREFRKRVLFCISVFLCIFISLLYFSNDIYSLLAHPLLKYLPEDRGLIATDVVSPFFVPIELAMIAALLLSVPIFLYQIWSFIAPALYQHERVGAWAILLASTVLFYLGVLFAYFVVLPILFHFLIDSAPVTVYVSPDIAKYLHFTVKLLVMFGILFEVPVITILLISIGLVSRARFIQMRSGIIVASFIIGMLLTPPDVISQTLLAVPLWLLFEAGIFLAPFIVRGLDEKVNYPISNRD